MVTVILSISVGSEASLNGAGNRSLLPYLIDAFYIEDPATCKQDTR